MEGLVRSHSLQYKKTIVKTERPQESVIIEKTQKSLVPMHFESDDSKKRWNNNVKNHVKIVKYQNFWEKHWKCSIFS